MRKLVLLMMFLFVSGCYAGELPDSVREWRCVKESVTPLVLDANGENLGRIVYRDYEREAPKGYVQVIMTEGSGTGSLYVPESVRDSEGVMPSDAGYRVLSIAGRKAIMEAKSYMPLVLAIAAGENVVVTIESGSLGEDELVSFAEEMLSRWRNTE